MPDLLDIGEPTDEAASLSDEQLDAILGGVDTAALDAAVDQAYGEYLGEWGREIGEHIEDRGREKSWRAAHQKILDSQSEQKDNDSCLPSNP